MSLAGREHRHKDGAKVSAYHSFSPHLFRALRLYQGALFRILFIPSLLGFLGFDTIGAFLYTLTHHRYVNNQPNFTAV